jgi:DNA-binding response OmpR family regulator
VGAEEFVLGAGDAVVKRGKVLVIDDEPSIVELFTDYLNGQGFDVISAGGGEEGLDRLRLDSPDIVLLDMRMPGIDGLETLTRIRKVNQRVPVLMVSGNDDIAAAKSAIALGAFDYTLKPVDFNYLGRALDKMLALAASAAEPGLVQPEAAAGSAHGLLYDLSLEVFRTTRTLSASARESIAPALESAALSLVQRGGGGDKAETVRALNVIRALLRFAKDLGDLTDETHRTLESHMAKARRSVGLS